MINQRIVKSILWYTNKIIFLLSWPVLAYKVPIQSCISHLLSNLISSLLAFVKLVLINRSPFISKVYHNLIKIITIAIILMLWLIQPNCRISSSNIILSKSFHWYTYWMFQKSRPIITYLIQSYIWILSLQKALKNYVRILTIKFLKLFYINIVTLLI